MPHSALGWLRLLVVPVLGILAIAGGLLALRAQPVSFGWFAYAPLSSDAFVPGPPWLWQVGLALLVLGFAAIAGWAGFLLGRRSRR